VPSAQARLFDEKLAGALTRLARASIEDVFAAVARASCGRRRGARHVSDYKDERATMPAAPKSETGWFGLRKASGVFFKFKVPTGTAGRHPIAHQQRPAGELCAQRRRVPGDASSAS